MLTFEELGPKQCRYPVTADKPYLFCGASTQFTYCPAHHALCHEGHGKPWQGLAGMMEAVEATIIPTPRHMADVQPPIDEALRSTRIDKPLMERL